MNPQQYNSQDLRDKIQMFVQHWSSWNPQVHKLGWFVNHLEPDQPFIVILNTELTHEAETDIFVRLTSLRDGVHEDVIRNKLKNTSDILQLYHISIHNQNGRTVYLGTRNKADRVCRFCNNTRTPLTFKTKAHSISEALGNKKIFTNDECDVCNQYFGSGTGIENDLITYLQVWGAFRGVRGKRGAQSIKGKNFSITQGVEIIPGLGKMPLLIFEHGDTAKAPETKTTSVTLEMYENYNSQNCYRALCKFFINVVSDEYLPLFADTIDWINGNRTIPELPRIAISYSEKLRTDKCGISIYIRKNDDHLLPFAVAELHVAGQHINFIVPFCESDKLTFTTESEFMHYWNTFKHWHPFGGWQFMDFSNDYDEPMKMDLNVDLTHAQLYEKPDEVPKNESDWQQ